MNNLELETPLIKAAIETILERYGCSLKVLNFDTKELDVHCPENVSFEEKTQMMDEILSLLEDYSPEEYFSDIEED